MTANLDFSSPSSSSSRLVSARLAGSADEQRAEMSGCAAKPEAPCRPLPEITPRDLLVVVLDAFASAEMLASD